MSMSITPSFIVLAVLCGITGLNVLVVLRKYLWVQTGIVTTGVVVDIRRVVTTNTVTKTVIRAGQHIPIIQFQTIAGDMISINNECKGTSVPPPCGYRYPLWQNVPVVYHMDNPQEGKIKSFDELYGGTLYTLGIMLFLLLGWLLTVSLYPSVST